MSICGSIVFFVFFACFVGKLILHLFDIRVTGRTVDELASLSRMAARRCDQLAKRVDAVPFVVSIAPLCLADG